MAKMVGVSSIDVMNKHIINAREIAQEKEKDKDKRNVGSTTMPKPRG